MKSARQPESCRSRLGQPKQPSCGILNEDQRRRTHIVPSPPESAAARSTAGLGTSPRARPCGSLPAVFFQRFLLVRRSLPHPHDSRTFLRRSARRASLSTNRAALLPLAHPRAARLGRRRRNAHAFARFPWRPRRAPPHVPSRTPRARSAARVLAFCLPRFRAARRHAWCGCSLVPRSTFSSPK